MQTITLTELHQSIGETLSKVHYSKQPVLVTKRGRPFVFIQAVKEVKDAVESERATEINQEQT